MTFKQLCLPILAGVMSLSLLGCAKPYSAPTIVEKVQYIGLPTQLLQDCTRADLTRIRSNGDLVVVVLEQDDALARCNLDKAAIRELQPVANPE